MYQSDPKFKKYTQQVERSLNSFDNVHEWADFIAFLKQLLKVKCIHLTRLLWISLKKGLLPDIPVIYAIQGNSSQDSGGQTSSAMFESCFA